MIERLRTAVRAGTLPAGTQLPASRTLAADLGVSRGVVVRAYEQLTAEGYLSARRGSRTEVAAVPGVPTSTVLPAQKPPTNPGLPAGSTFPRAAWLRAVAQALRTLPDADLGYGHPAGHERLRTELASYLGRVRGVLAPAEQIVVVNGFAQASRLLADVLLARGIDAIGLEDPGSRGLREQLTRAGLTCVPVPVDADGIRVDALEESSLRAVVVTPAHQFPTGVVMSPDRRHALLSWARSAEAVVVEDDYDAEFRYDRAAVGALQGLGADVVLYGGSVSKTLAPALRLGWLVVPTGFVSAFLDAKYATDLSTGSIEQVALAEFLAAGEMDRHIRRMALRYRTRRDALVAAVRQELPRWDVTGAAAGLHLLLRPPTARDEAALARLAQEAGLDARPLASFTTTGEHRAGLVIGYGHRHPDALTSAIRRLAGRLDDGVPTPRSHPPR